MNIDITLYLNKADACEKHGGSKWKLISAEALVDYGNCPNGANIFLLQFITERGGPEFMVSGYVRSDEFKESSNYFQIIDQKLKDVTLYSSFADACNGSNGRIEKPYNLLTFEAKSCPSAEKAYQVWLKDVIVVDGTEYVSLIPWGWCREPLI